MSSFVCILNRVRATGSIRFNITELIVLGDLWNSDTLVNVGNSLNDTVNDANVGEIQGNKMFYTNDYMVSDQDPQGRSSSSPSLRFTVDQVTSVRSGCIPIVRRTPSA